MTHATRMQAIDFDTFGPPDVLHTCERPMPTLRPDDLLLRVHAAGVNRADLNLRQGKYGERASFGDSMLMGLELCGTVVAQGEHVDTPRLGQRVMGIVGGGAYAAFARIPSNMAVEVPTHLSDVQAAALMEALVTAHQALVHLGQLQAGQAVLIHGAGGGVGTLLVQMAAQQGASVIATTSSGRKHDALQTLGATLTIDYQQQDFLEAIRTQTPAGGVDLIVDCIGGPYLERNIRALNVAGRLIQLGLQGGGSGNLPLDLVLHRRLRIEGTVMKTVSQAEKAAMTARAMQAWANHLETGRLQALIAETFPLSEASRAHHYVEHNNNIGKVVLTV